MRGQIWRLDKPQAVPTRARNWGVFWEPTIGATAKHASGLAMQPVLADIGNKGMRRLTWRGKKVDAQWKLFTLAPTIEKIAPACTVERSLQVPCSDCSPPVALRRAMAGRRHRQQRR